MLTPRAQALVVLIAVSCIGFIVRMVRRRQIKVKYLLLWLIVALAASVLAAFPRGFDLVAQWAGVAYPPTFLFLMAIAFLLFVVIQFSWELSRLEDRTRRLAEELALLRLSADQTPPAARTDGSAAEAIASSDAKTATS